MVRIHTFYIFVYLKYVYVIFEIKKVVIKYIDIKGKRRKYNKGKSNKLQSMGT